MLPAFLKLLRLLELKGCEQAAQTNLLAQILQFMV